MIFVVSELAGITGRFPVQLHARVKLQLRSTDAASNATKKKELKADVNSSSQFNQLVDEARYCSPITIQRLAVVSAGERDIRTRSEVAPFEDRINDYNLIIHGATTTIALYIPIKLYRTSRSIIMLDKGRGTSDDLPFHFEKATSPSGCVGLLR